MANKTIIRTLVKNGLKVTPQRVAILECIISLDNHPSVDNITRLLRLSYPNISLATIYNSLDAFSKKGIIKKVLTKNEPERFDTVGKKHHHLYSTETDRIEDYYDDNLDHLLEDFFKTKKIRNFEIEDIKLQISGKFLNPDKNDN